LQKNGVPAATVLTCPGITILKDANGEPTGVIVETNDRPMVEFDILPAVPRFGWQQRLDGIRTSMKLYNAVGTTGIYEGHGSSPQTLYRTLWEQGELNVRASSCLTAICCPRHSARSRMFAPASL
jgi:predicted amidohydrolase YtcJ